ncbi:hypothetical protein [Cupriavidus necator]|uniref:hypothetical protein n=1 Tax=Cupriavidus necator TaxID=106590 RepID=UPI0030F43F4E
MDYTVDRQAPAIDILPVSDRPSPPFECPLTARDPKAAVAIVASSCLSWRFNRRGESHFPACHSNIFMTLKKIFNWLG